MKLQERINNVQEAEQLIAQAINLITDAVQDTPEQSMTMAYTVGHLNTWIGNGNPYDHHTGKIIEGLKEWNDDQGHCERCHRDKPMDEFIDEGLCEECYEKSLEG